MNLVLFKLKSDCVDKYFEVIDKTGFVGMSQRYIAKTVDYDYCFVGIWKSAEAIAGQIPVMIFTLMMLEDLCKSCLLNLELLILFQEILFLKLGIMINMRSNKFKRKLAPFFLSCYINTKR